MKKWFIVGIGLLAASAACVVADDPPATKKAAPKFVTAIGRVEPAEVVDVGAMVAGQIQKIVADYGTEVKAGEVLAQLETATYETEVTRARANVDRAQAKRELAKAKMSLARRQLERLLKLRDAKAVDESEIETGKAELEVAEAALRLEEAGIAESQAALKRAALDLSYCTIRSPIEGVVLDRRCHVGQRAVSSLDSPSLFLIAKDLKAMRVLAAVKEADIARVAVGQGVEFQVDALPGETLRGQVAQIRLNAKASKDTVTYTVVVDVNNRSGKLLPSMTARVKIAAAERP